MEKRQIRLDVSASSRAPERVRRSLDDLADEVGREAADSILLLVNELVTNSVKFAGKGHIQVRLEKDGDGAIRVEVRDDGPGFVPSRAEPELMDTSGRGLFLVEALADRWGVSMDGRTCVWFEVDG